jgi:thiol-disulfide isomerase/thioredoxin
MDNLTVTELVGRKMHDNFLAQNQFAIVFYGSKNCPHCVSFAPIIKSMAENVKNIPFGHVEATQTNVIGVKGFPTTVGFINSTIFDQVIGADTNGLKTMIEKMLAKKQNSNYH